MDINMKDRAMGAIVGMFVGDALGLGPHWFYDLSEMKRQYGEWISDYADPMPDRYHAGRTAGDISQTGQVALLLLASLAERGEYWQDDFTNRLDSFLETLDGTPTGAQGGRYTDIAMREVWKARRDEKEWKQAGSMADTSEAAVRGVMLAAMFSGNPRGLAEHAMGNILLTHREPFVAAQSLAFVMAVCRLIRGKSLKDSGKSLMGWAQKQVDPALIDVFLHPGFIHEAAVNPELSVEPPHLIGQLYGLACQLGFLAPAAYYLASRFSDDFEGAVLNAVNGGGNNMARAAMTGALAGASVGMQNIPQRFIEGLKDGKEILACAEKVVAGIV